VASKKPNTFGCLFKNGGISKHLKKKPGQGGSRFAWWDKKQAVRVRGASTNKTSKENSPSKDGRGGGPEKQFSRALKIPETWCLPERSIYKT